MALTITETKRTVIGNLKYVAYEITDGAGNGGTVDTGLINIVAMDIVNITAVSREPTISKSGGVVTIGTETNAADILLLTVAGW